MRRATVQIYSNLFFVGKTKKIVEIPLTNLQRKNETLSEKTRLEELEYFNMMSIKHSKK
jgi:hypothetical protein